MIDQNDIVNRGNCFKLLAACFYEPDKNLFMEEQLCENLVNLLSTWAGPAARIAGEMGSSLRTCTQEQLSIDHAALFVGPFELVAAPYGSVYKEQHRQVMGWSTIEVIRFYQDAGLSVESKEPADHVAIELEFMHYLCLKEAEAEMAGNQSERQEFRHLQSRFFQTALLWVPQFCDSIKKGTTNPFYSGLADCLREFMTACGPMYKTEGVPGLPSTC
jgi:TorA maturation chaperone TorD